ncbi:hypothetical protein JCM17960_08030 [Magnetospira thiophila]
MISRRHFLTLGAAVGLSVLAPFTAEARRLLVVGGGVAGVTAAARLQAKFPESTVTLLDRFPSRRAAALLERGVRVASAEIVDVDWGQRRAIAWSGERYAFDRLILAPGVAFQAQEIEGYDGRAQKDMPHFWKDAEDEARFQSWLAAVETGGTVLLTVPRRPHRFMVGPYLRAMRAAATLARHNPRAKILLLDANPVPMTALPDSVERVVASLEAVDRTRRKVRTSAGVFTGDLINIIPEQWAGDLAQRIGLVDATGWCPVDFDTARSNMQDTAFVIGDAVRTGQGDKTAAVALAQGERVTAALVV